MWAASYGRGSLGAIHGVGRASQVLGFAFGPLVAGIAIRPHRHLPGGFPADGRRRALVAAVLMGGGADVAEGVRVGVIRTGQRSMKLMLRKTRG